MLLREVQDPRLAGITVSAVEVSRDLAHARVYVTFLGTDDKAVETGLQGLEHAAGFLRSLLAKRLKIRTVPDLHFIHDISIIRGARLSALIDEAVDRDRRDTPGSFTHEEAD